MDMIVRKLQQYMSEYHMVQRDDHVCVGFSGGADSVFLMQFLWEMKEQFHIKVSACHVNHQIRGAESDADEAFVEAFCKERGIPLYCFTYPVEELSAKWRIGTEETGRKVRQEAFHACAIWHGVTKIALAHHQNDQAETVIFQMARGSSIAGMAGIRPVNGNTIRPLLCLRRGEIEEELRKKGISWCTDHTNLEDDYSRNKIRHHVTSYMEKEINAGAISHIAEMAEQAAKAEDFLRTEARQRAKKYVIGTENIYISEDLMQEPVIMQEYILMDVLAELLGKRKDIGKIHIDKLRELFELETSKEIALPGKVKAVRCYEHVSLTKGKGAKEVEAAKGEFFEVAITGSGKYQCKDVLLEVTVYDERPAVIQNKIEDNKYTKWFDYDKIKNGLVVRNRKAGDFFVLDSAGHRKKLKEYFIEQKIPKLIREDVLLLASGQKVFWIIGERISEDAKVVEMTKKCVCFHIVGGHGNE